MMNRFLLVLILILSFLITAHAQSVRSDSLFAKGVELYKAEKYKEALPFFQQSDRLDKLEIDSLSERRYYSEIWVASCLYKLGLEDEAININRLQYKFQPIDRRQTLEIDSIIDATTPEMMKGNYSLALLNYQKLNEKEKKMFGPEHYSHINTNRMIALCLMHSQQYSESVPYIEESIRLIRLNYSPTDTLQLSDLSYLLNLKMETGDIAGSYKCRHEIAEILDHNFPPESEYHLQLQRTSISLELFQRNWKEANKLLQDYLPALQKLCADNPEKFSQEVLYIRQLFVNCGRHEECLLIDEFVTNNFSEDSPEKKFASELRNLISEINLKNAEKADDSLSRLYALIKEMPENEQKEKKMIADYMDCGLLMLKGKNDEATDLFLALEEEKEEEIIKENEIIWPLYLSVKMAVDIALSNFEGASHALDTQIAALPVEMKVDHINQYAFQACLKALAGDYKKAREITDSTISVWEENVVDRKALYRLDKDTAQLNMVLNTFDNYIRAAENMPDSVSYTIRDIKKDYILLKAKMLKNLDLYQIDYDYYDCISDYALELVRIHKLPEAREVMDSWLEDWKKTFDSIDPNTEDPDLQLDRVLGLMTLHDALNFRCRFIYEKGDPEGIKAFDDLFALLKYEYDGSTESEDYIKTKIQYYDFMDDRQGYVDYISEIYLTNPEMVDPLLLSNMASAYDSLGDKNKANSTREKALIGIINYPENYKDNFNTVLSQIVEYYARTISDTESLFKLYEEVLWPALDNFKDENFDYFISSINQLAFYIQEDNFIGHINKETGRNPGLIDSKYKKAVLNQTIAGVLSLNRKIDKALEYLAEAKELIKDDVTLSLLLDIYRHKILSQGEKEDREQLIDLGNELINRMHSDHRWRETVEYICLINRQMEALSEENRYEDMISLEDKCLHFLGNKTANKKEREHLFNESHPLYPEMKVLNNNYLHDFSILNEQYIRQDLMKAMSVMNPENASTLALDVIKDNFDNLNTTMELNLVRSQDCDDLINISTKYAANFPSDSLKMYAYDTSLFCKGLQMRSDYAIRALIQESGHKGALRKFDELQTVNYKLSNAPESASDSLLEKKKNLEKDLLRLSRSFGDYKKLLYSSWKDVRQALKDQDIAIEFTLSSPHYTDASEKDYKTGYYACIITKDMDCPEVVYICDANMVSTDVSIYETPEVSQLLMKPLEPYLNNIENIYYSPIGVFNRIAIESLPDLKETEKPLSFHYNFHRLSSTREIIGNNISTEGKDAVVYGGLAYDTSIEEMENDSKKYSNVRRSLSRNDDDNINLEEFRGLVKTIPYLQGTKMEAEGVTNTINSASRLDLHATPFTGTEGTETSFKSLDGQHIRLIHIATHGFYFSEKDFNNMHGHEEGKDSKLKDDPLKRSGLFFSGAANIYKGREIPEGIDDGILTSHEISGMDLSGLDLIVLSACQTAQGDISSEGVYGLQRGFKIAGAKSILMSLWPVDDEATCFLMTEFYKNLITLGKSKHQALELAKNSVKSQKEKGWDNPKYWAAFIFLDALD